MSSPQPPTAGFSVREMAEFRRVCGEHDLNPGDAIEARVAAALVRAESAADAAQEAAGMGPYANQKRSGDPGPSRAYLYVRIGDWDIYGWRLVVLAVTTSIAMGIGRALAGAFLG